MAKLPRLSLLLGGALCAALSLVACAQGDPPDPGTGGGGTGGSTSTGGTGGDTSSGVCNSAEQCAGQGDACNVGACINGVCGKLPMNEGMACDDGKACSENDVCQKGVCTPGSLKPCTSSNPCMVGTCDVETDSCVEMPGNSGAPCSTGDACIAAASCAGGVCMPYQQVDCSFLDGPCTTGYCDPSAGCQALAKENGAPCEDFKFCTVQDQCVDGQCKGYPNTCGTAVKDPCKTGVCNETLQSCVAVAGNDGAACDDGNLCTTGETCFAGGCLGGSPTNEGAVCDDANGCTEGTSCVGGACGNPQSEISSCVDGDMCCPAGCAGDKDCLYWEAGVQVDVPLAKLNGWTQCYSESYDGFTVALPQILSQCDKAKLLMACRPIGAASFTTLAMAPREDVLFECGSDPGCTHESNGVGWYYNAEYSWGYAPAGSPVNRNSCDVVDSQSYPGITTDGDKRICWHTGGGFVSSGWRCGKADFLGGTYERLLFEAD